MQQKLIPPQRVAQVRFKQLPFCKSLRACRRRKNWIVIPAVLFGFVHRGVCFIHQAFRVWPVAGVGAHPNAHVYIKTLAIDNMRLRQCPEDFSCAEGRVFLMLDLGEEYNEFVPAQPAYRVRPPDTSHQSPGYRLQQFVANPVAQ